MRERPWRVPVTLSEVPETGRHLDLVADAQVRAAIAKLAGLAALPRLNASFDVTRHRRDGLRIVGQVSATVGQTCVVTLEPIENEIEESIDLVFVPAAAASFAGSGEIEVPIDDAPEAMLDGAVDLGALATEFLILGVDPYPRKPGAVFQLPAAGDDAARPFAALAALKKGQGGGAG
jgi:uncharacterized metal-binding protein YceD (DUF177 family)